MATDLPNMSDASVTALVTGIIDDAQELFKQQVALLKHEIKDEIHQAKVAARSLAWGMGLAVIGGFLLCSMLPLLLNWAVDGALPLWACFGIVGAAFAVIGGGMLYAGKQKLEAVHPVQHSVEAFKDNLQLKT